MPKKNDFDHNTVDDMEIRCARVSIWKKANSQHMVKVIVLQRLRFGTILIHGRYRMNLLFKRIHFREFIDVKRFHFIKISNAYEMQLAN